MIEESTAGQLSWLLDDLVDQVPHVRQAVVLSPDGLMMATSRGLAARTPSTCRRWRPDSRAWPAAPDAFHGGPVRQTIVEMESAFLFVTAAGQGACLAVLGRSDADVGLIAYEMAMLVTRVGQNLHAPPRRAPVAPIRCRRESMRHDRADGHSGSTRTRARWSGPYAMTRGRARPAGGEIDLMRSSSRPRRRARPPRSGSSPSTTRSWRCAGNRCRWPSWPSAPRLPVGVGPGAARRSARHGLISSYATPGGVTAARRRRIQGGCQWTPGALTATAHRRAIPVATAQDPGRRAASASARPRMVGAVSEIRPLRTEEILTDRSVGVDDLAGVEGKTTTTVAMDFGRITITRRPGAVPVRHARPGPVLVHVGRAGAGRARRGGAGRHPPAGRLLPLDRLLRAARHPVHRGGQLLRRRHAATTTDEVRVALDLDPESPWCSATRVTGSRASRC